MAFRSNVSCTSIPTRLTNAVDSRHAQLHKLTPNPSAVCYICALRRSLLNAMPGAWRLHMRMIMLVQCPIEPFNTLVKKGTVGAKMKAILAATKPEAAYFTEREGHRGAIFVVGVNGASDSPDWPNPGSSASMPKSSSALP
jgi:hypothetical protein